MSEGTSAEQLPINLATEYRVKLGKSFTFPEKNAFHTLKCEYWVKSCSKFLPTQVRNTIVGLWSDIL